MLLYWTKGVNHMIEIVYKEEKQEARGNESYFQLPKNIRQIGDCKGKQKIYLEDYVYTYLKKLSADPSSGKAAILLGQYNWADGTAYFFLRGALEITSMEVSADSLKFDEQVWKEVGDTIEKYFRDQNILGWFLSLPGDMEENDERILKIHLNHFGGNDKVLFRMEPSEKEEAFYTYDNGALKKLDGFYIYYEKNEAMQNYMVDHNQNASVEDTGKLADQAVSDFRKIVGQKQEQKKKKTVNKGLAYGVTVCAAAAVLAFGLNFAARDQGSQRDQGAQSGSQTVAANGNAVSGSRVSQTVTPQAEEKQDDVSAAGQQDTIEGQEDTQRNSSETGDTQAGSGGDRNTQTGGSETGDGQTGNSETGNAQTGSNETGDGQTESSETGEGQTGSGEIENGQTGSSVQTGRNEQDNGQTTDRETNQVSEESDRGASEETSSVAAADILTEYTVRKGDSLSKISERYYGTMNRVKDICAVNGITSEDVIYAGQKILLPK